MIEHIRNNWKVILIFILVAFIVFLLYQRGKEMIAQESQEIKHAVGNTENADVVEVAKEVKEPAAVETPASPPPINVNDIFADYRGGKIKREAAIEKSGLPKTTFYKKLGKYDNRKTDVI